MSDSQQPESERRRLLHSVEGAARVMRWRYASGCGSTSDAEISYSRARRELDAFDALAGKPNQEIRKEGGADVWRK